MPPEEQIIQLKQELENLRQEFHQLKTAATIPYEIDSAFRERLTDLLGDELSVSSKNVDSEDQAVNEAGSASYNVLKEPDGFLQVTINQTTYYLPFYG